MYLNFACYIELGIFEKKLLKVLDIKSVALINLGIVVLGMVFRYLLEFGEVSNTYNFTPPNVLVHVATTFVISMCAFAMARK